MTNVIAALLRLFERLLDHLEARRLKQEQQQHQDNIDEIHANPVDYANAKFGKRLRKPKQKAVQRGDADKP